MEVRSSQSRRCGSVVLVAVGVLMVGLTLRATPPGIERPRSDVEVGDDGKATLPPDDRAPVPPNYDRGRVVPASTMRYVTSANLPAAGDMALRRARIISAIPAGGIGGPPDGSAIACLPPGIGAAVGSLCTCDDDCCGLTSADGCTLGQCIWNECAAVPAMNNSRCEADGDWCTLERCDGEGNCLSLDDGTGVCDPSTTGDLHCLSRCAKQCNGGSRDGRWCDWATDCPVGSCEIKPGGVCNDTTPGAEFCGLASGLGRCCTAGVCTYTTAAGCMGD